MPYIVSESPVITIRAFPELDEVSELSADEEWVLALTSDLNGDDLQWEWWERKAAATERDDDAVRDFIPSGVSGRA